MWQEERRLRLRLEEGWAAHPPRGRERLRPAPPSPGRGNLGSANLEETRPLICLNFPPRPLLPFVMRPTCREGVMWERILSASHQGRPVETIRFQTLITQRGPQPREGQQRIQSYTAGWGRRGHPSDIWGLIVHWHHSLILVTTVIVCVTTIVSELHFSEVQGRHKSKSS